MEYRFEHSGRQIRWSPIDGLTDADFPQALPLNSDRVESRIRRQGDAVVDARAFLPVGNDHADSVEHLGEPTAWPESPANALSPGAASSPA